MTWPIGLVIGALIFGEPLQAQQYEMPAKSPMLESEFTEGSAWTMDELLIHSELSLECQATFNSTESADCSEFVPRLETGPLSNIVSWGRFRYAYIQRAQLVAIDAGHCGCPFDLVTFDAFSLELVGKASEELAQSDLRVFSDYYNATFDRARDGYRAFRQEVCGI